MTSLKCTNCGLVNFATATECKRCHLAFADVAEAVADDSLAGNGTFQNAVNSFSGHVSNSGRTHSSSAELYYQPSGAVTMLGLAAGLLGGLNIGIILGIVYSYIIAYIPFIYVNFLCTLGFAVGLGASVGSLMKWGKVRNTTVCLLVTFMVTLLSFYVSWTVWLSVMLSRGDFEVSTLTLMQNPLGFLALVQKVNEVGVWSMFSMTFSGVGLWIVWGVEALIILIGAPCMAWAVVTSDLFCESCQMWCEENKSIVALREAESGDLKRRVEAKDFEYLKSVGVKPEGAATWYRIDLHNCPNCSNTNALSVQLEHLKIDAKGNSSVQSKSFMDKLLLSATETNQLRQISNDLTQSGQAA